MILPYVSQLSAQKRIILASGSPRRRELLGGMGLKFEVRGGSGGGGFERQREREREMRRHCCWCCTTTARQNPTHRNDDGAHTKQTH